jgi:hypothetical protein
MRIRRLLSLPCATVLLAGCATTTPPLPSLEPVHGMLRSSETLPRVVEQSARFAGQQHAIRLDALTGLLQELGLDYRVHDFSNPHSERDPRETGHNVEVLLGNPAATRAIIVGAHYDAKRFADGSYTDGMVDNAAGSVVLAHVARALRDHPLEHQLRVVFFDLEESGLLGSAQFAASLTPGTVAAMVNLDVQGYGDTVLFGPASNPGNAAPYASMHRVCAELRIRCMEFPRYPSSDDRSFQAAGIPNISIAVMPATEAHQMWLLLNGGADNGLREGFLPAALATIHSSNDTVDKLDAASMTLGHDAVVALLLDLDHRLK